MAISETKDTLKTLQLLNWLFYVSVSSWYSQNRNGSIITKLLPKSSIQGVRNSTSNKLLHIPRLTKATHVLRVRVREIGLDWLAGTFVGLLTGPKPFISEPFAKYGQEKSKKWSFYCIGLDLLSGSGDDIWDQDFKQVLDTRSLGGPPGPNFKSVALRASLTSSFAPFGRSGRVTHADVSMMHVSMMHVSMMHVSMIHVSMMYVH